MIPSAIMAQTSYSVVTLDGLGGTASGANSINNRGWASGSANRVGDSVSHAALWIKGTDVIDLGSLGGPDSNSAVAWPVKNNIGLIVGISDTADDNPLGEAFSCWPFFASGSPTRKICRGFRWVNGVMTALPPFPGGYNSYATAANNRGQVVGWAENGVHDPSCDSAFQILQFRAAIWEPNGEMQELPPLPGDSTSAATAINDQGQVVGISGACGVAVGDVSAAHAVLWENGVPTDIGNLGGTTWNTPTAINSHGTVVGFSLPGDQNGTRNYEAFIWTRDGGLHSLGKLPGDIRSAAFGVNDRNQVVGLSRGGPFGIRAFIWENGVLTDLNDLTLSGSPYLLYANDINDSGQLVGEAFDADTGEAPAFLATPVHRPQ
jgi:probable HAF family extracellular repeat protein